MAKPEITLRKAKAASFTDNEGVEHRLATLDVFGKMMDDFSDDTPVVVEVNGLYRPVDPSVIEFAPFGGKQCVILHIDPGAMQPDYELVDDESPVH